MSDFTIEQLEQMLAEAKKKNEDRLFIENHHEQALLEDTERSKKVVLHNFSVVNDRFFFEAEDNALLKEFLRGFISRVFTNGFNSIEVKHWKDFQDKLPRNVSLEITDEQRNSIENWVPPADWVIGLDEDHFTVKPGPKTNAFKISEWQGVFYRHGKMHWIVPKHIGWRLLTTVIDDKVEWAEGTKEICEEQIKKRAELDNIYQTDFPLDMSFGSITLKPFQETGIRYGIATGGNTLIADEMGLGKSVQGVGIAMWFIKNNGVKKVLIVCPAALRINWAKEIYKITGQQAYVFFGSQPTKMQLEAWLLNKYTYYIIAYDSIGEKTVEVEEKNKDTKYYWVEALNLIPSDLIISDEIHKAKNIESHRSQALRKLVSKYKIGLSGTLLINRPRELWVPLAWLDPIAAGPYETFVKRYEDNWSRSVKNVDELREMLKTYMIRRTKLDVIKELDEINRITREYELTKPAQAKYEKVLAGLWEGLDKWDGNPANQTVITNILAQIMRMKQICAQDKVDYIADLAVECYDSNTTNWKKVIIFSQFVNDPAIVSLINARLGGESVMFTGDTPMHERTRIVEQFQTDDNIHFLVASTMAAGEGLNITAAGSVIFADLMWTPAAHHQAEGRAYGRLSDLHTIDSYYVVANNTIEDTIMDILESKLATFKEIIDGVEVTRSSSIAMEVISKLKGLR